MRTPALLLTALVIALAGRIGVAAQAQTPAPSAAKPAGSAAASGVKPVASIKQLMHAIVIPASDGLFKAAGEPPTSDDGWAAAQHQALAVAEGGNLLMIGNRPAGKADWTRLSRAMLDAASEAAAAAQKKNGDALSAASDKLYETCENCHAKYMNK
jgi:hypothetical protein